MDTKRMNDEQAAAFALAVKVRNTLLDQHDLEGVGDDFNVEEWTALYEDALRAAKRFNAAYGDEGPEMVVHKMQPYLHWLA